MRYYAQKKKDSEAVFEYFRILLPDSYYYLPAAKPTGHRTVRVDGVVVVVVVVAVVVVVVVVVGLL